jgi:hypothetical protein
MAFEGEKFVDQFNTVWNGHDLEGILAPLKVEGCDILTIRDGKIAAKRSYRKGVV